MVKKKISGQTLAIIILTVLLLIAVAFGGVYAFYSAKSNQVAGEIRMATLEIGMGWEAKVGQSTSSAIVLSNGKEVVPGQELDNTPLIVENKSQVSIYVIVVYELKAEVKDKSGNVTKVVEDKKEGPLIDLGASYCNDRDLENVYLDVRAGEWVDYVFTTEEGGVEKVYRAMISTVPRAPKEQITVIEKDSFKLSSKMNNDYQGTTISLTFQAYAIGSETFNSEFTESTPKVDKAKRIIESIHENYTVIGFLNIKESQE